jgi:hypothetical protein
MNVRKGRTPRPWAWFGLDLCGRVQEPEGKGAKVILRLDPGGPIPSAEDARLIAAAPRLLESCRRVLSRHQSCPCSTCEACRDIIAEVEGSS